MSDYEDTQSYAPKISNAEKQKAYRRRKGIGPRTKKCKVTLQLPFIGWDGEGFTENVRRKPRHIYTLLANSCGEYIRNDTGISTSEAVNFILEQAQLEPAIHVGFAFSYDVNMMLKNLSDEELCDLNDGEHTFWTDNVRRYQLSFRARKFFDIKRFRGDKVYYRHTITKGPNTGKDCFSLDLEAKCRIWDVFGFFQRSFVKALGDYFTNEELPELTTIIDMKKKRSKFRATDFEQVRDYCIIECQYLAKLMSRLREYLQTVGINNTQWHGTGAIASTVMRDAGVRKYIAGTPENIREFLLCAYSGGRIETTGIGRLTGTLYDYDLNSAYPSIQANLPCLRCAKWVYSREPLSPWYIARVDYFFGINLPWHPLFFRTEKGEIRYPTSGSGWYWQDEVQAAIMFHNQTKIKGIKTKCEVREVWNLIVGCDHKPFSFLTEQYRQRSIMKREKNPAQQALKLSINSCYGKTMQQIGGTKDNPPPYFSLEWGGMITSGVRAKLVTSALTTSLNDVLFFATDGILTRSTLNVPLGNEMGTWELKNDGKPYDEAVIVLPGVYWLRSGNNWVTASRGFEDTSGGEPTHILQAWQAGKISLGLKQTRFNTLKQSARRSGQERSVDRDKWTRWTSEPRELSLLGNSAKRYPYGGSLRSLRGGFFPLRSREAGATNSYPYEVSNWRTLDERLSEEDDFETESC